VESRSQEAESFFAFESRDSIPTFRFQKLLSYQRFRRHGGNPLTSSSDLPQAGSPAAEPQPQLAPILEKKSPPMLMKVFIGPNGIRAGWRLLIFVLIFAAIANALNFGIRRIPAVRAVLKTDRGATLSPTTALLGEGLLVVTLLASTFFMTLIEKRKFSDYGLPARGAFGKQFWLGVPFGFAMLSILLAGIGAGHGLSLGGLAITGPAAIEYGLVWGVAFVLVGIFEEFSFRGYLQATLGSGIGFWWAAIVLSCIFGAIHLGNSGEGKFGALMAGTFGLVAAFSVLRTGSLWFAIGMHASWDWGETYFYGTPDSGLVARGHLLNSTLHGPAWLTGGTVGPEGSYLVLLVLLLGAAGIHLLFPARPRGPQT
jgi:membrane protease YdiL (CAAX protease family)